MHADPGGTMSKNPQDAHHPRPSPPVIRGELAPPGYADPGHTEPGAHPHAPLAGSAAPLRPAAVPYRPAAVQPYAQPAGHPGTGPYGAPPGPVPMLLPLKSVGAAFVLTFFFGPLGMLYSTVGGALVMIGVTLGLAVLTGIVLFVISLVTLGIGAVLAIFAPLVGLPVWIASMIWGCLAASRHNERVQAQLAAFGGHRPPGY